MNVKQLQAVRAVVACGTVTDAAATMTLTQPAVSRLLLQLEAEIGFPLFHRNQGRLWITPEGETFSREAGRVLAHLDHLSELARDVRRLRVGYLRIVAMPTIAYGILPQALAEFSRRHADVEVEVNVRQRKDLEAVIASEPFDVAFTSLPLENTNVESNPLILEEAVCILPRGHQLETKDSVSAADFDGARFIAGVKNTLLRIRLDEIFAKEHVRPRQVLVAETTIMACELVAHGLGVSVVHGLLTRNYADRITVRPFAHRLMMQYGTILPIRRPRSQLVDVLVDIVKAQGAMANGSRQTTHVHAATA